VDVSASQGQDHDHDHEHVHAVATTDQPAQVVSQLPSLEQIKANLPRPQNTALPAAPAPAGVVQSQG